MTRRTADAGEHARSRLDRRRFARRERIDQSQRGELQLRGRTRLRGKIDGQRRNVAHRQLVHDAVAVAVDVVADEFHCLHSDFVVRRVAVEVANRGDAALPLKRPHDQIGGDAGHLRRVVGDRAGRAAPAHRADPAEAHAFRGQVGGCRCGRAERAQLRAGEIARLLQFVGHLFGEALHGAEPEGVRRVALNEVPQLAAVPGIAMDVADRGSRSIVEQLNVTGGAGIRVRSGRPLRRVHRPLPGGLEIGARKSREP